MPAGFPHRRLSARRALAHSCALAVVACTARTSPWYHEQQPADADACPECPLELSYACASQVWLRSQVNRSNTPLLSIAGGTYTIDPALPAGLVLDPTTGAISGTPTSVFPTTQHRVSVTSPAGAGQTTIELRTTDGYAVDDLGDHDYVGPGCRSTNGGSCTLRAAVGAINAGDAATVVVLPPGAITLSLGQISITAAMEMHGDCAASTTLDGNASSRVLDISHGPTLLRRLTIENGLSDADGGGVRLDSPGPDSFSYTLEDLMVQNNHTATTGYGGGVYVGSSGSPTSLQLHRSVFRDNSSFGSGGGIAMVHDHATSVIDSCFFDRNKSLPSSEYSAGGGVAFRGGNVVVSNSLFVGNVAEDNGGGLDANSSSDGIVVTNSTFHGNEAARSGGGVFLNSNGNQLINCTVVDNRVINGGGGGFGANCSNCVTVANTLFSGNTRVGASDTCGASSTSLSSGGGNLFDTPQSDCPEFDSPFDRSGVGDALLGPLQDNGGLTHTHALLTGSPAVDAAVATFCPQLDQRGHPRESGACDSGAFELQ